MQRTKNITEQIKRQFRNTDIYRIAVMDGHCDFYDSLRLFISENVTDKYNMEQINDNIEKDNFYINNISDELCKEAHSLFVEIQKLNKYALKRFVSLYLFDINALLNEEDKRAIELAVSSFKSRGFNVNNKVQAVLCNLNEEYKHYKEDDDYDCENGYKIKDK